MFEKLRLLVTLEMKVFHKSIYILQDEAMTETVDALIEDGSKFLKICVILSMRWIPGCLNECLGNDFREIGYEFGSEVTRSMKIELSC